VPTADRRNAGQVLSEVSWLWGWRYCVMILLALLAGASYVMLLPWLAVAVRVPDDRFWAYGSVAFGQPHIHKAMLHRNLR